MPRRSSSSVAVLVLAVAAAAAAACYTAPLPSSVDPTENPMPTMPGSKKGATGTSGGENDGDDAPDGADPAGGTATGLPCDVDAVLQAKCRSCHGEKPRSPMSLVTYEDLVAPSKSDPSKSNAELSLERMKATSEPMPPNKANAATAGELDAFAKWIAAGLPAGTCVAKKPDAGAGGTSSGGSSGATGAPGAPGATGPADAGHVDAGATSGTCTSGLTWSPTNTPGTRMNPGKACVSCHQAATGGPILQIGGTVYPDLDEPDLCYGTQVPAYVVIKDATGRSVTLTTGATGNFTLSTSAAALTYPIKVKVVRNGKENAMVSSPPHGDCNACHTASGKNGAPGRIIAP